MIHYLDYAATSAVRPPAVARAVADFLTGCGGTPGRGGHSVGLEAGRAALRARRAVQEILGLPGDPGRLAFFQNATHALNTALWGTLRQGDAVVVSDYDHNAVLRPAEYLRKTRGVEVRVLSGTPEGGIDYQEAERLLDGARLLVVNAVSNVLGTALPVAELAARARSAGARVLVDTAQAAGHRPVSLARDGADLVAFTGHKGMLGPQGIGGLWVREGVDVEPLLRGGTGGDSTRTDMPDAMPDRLEAGTVNAPGLVGLEAGLAEVRRLGVVPIHRQVGALKARLRDGLASIPGVVVRSPAAPDGVGIVTVTVDGVSPATLAERLDREWQVQVRPGLHCAPRVHRLLGTVETGAVRFSLGWASTPEDVERALQGVEAVIGAGDRTKVNP